MSRQRRVATSVDVVATTPRRVSLVNVGFQVGEEAIEYVMIVTPGNYIDVLAWRVRAGGTTEVLAMRQFHPAAGETFNSIGGMLKEREAPEVAVRRELQEEVGIVPDAILNLEFLGHAVQVIDRGLNKIPAVGEELEPRVAHLCLAEINPGWELGEHSRDIEEDIEIIGWMPAEELLRQVLAEGRDERGCFKPTLVLMLQTLCLREAGVII